MNEARAAAISENQSQALPDESASSVQNVPEVSEMELSDIHSILTTMDFTSSLLSSETKQSAGCDVAAPKASAVQSMVGVMTKFTDHVETEFLSKILDATSSLKDCQDFTDSLKAVIAYLLDQNRLLLKCLGDIGTEAEKRADLLQQRLRETAVTTRDAVHKISDWGEVLLDLVNQKCLAEQAVLGARCVVEALSEENSRLKSRNENLDHDLHSLLSIVKVARTTGNWEMDCVTFCDLSPEDVYGTICRLSSTQNSEASRSVAMNDCARDGTANISEVEGACAMNGSTLESETDFLSISNHVGLSTPSEFRAWPGRRYPVLDEDTSGGTSYFGLPRYPATEGHGVENRKVAPRPSFYTRTSTSLDSFFTPLVPPSVNNDEKWARRRLFPSSPKLEQLIPYHPSDEPYHHRPLYAANVRLDRNAPSPSTHISSLEGAAACGELQSQDHQQPLCAALSVHAGNDGHPTKTSSHEDTAADGGPQPDHATYSGMAHHSLSVIDNSMQTEDSRKTSGVTSTQTDAELELSVPSGNVERDQELCSLRERLNLASQEAQSKTLLAMQLQTHLDSSSKQVELMEQALQNLEKKLSASRQECDDLKKEVTCVQVKLEHAEAATKKEQEVNTQLRTELQQLSVTVQHLRDALVELKKGGAPAAREEPSLNYGPKVHDV